MARTFPRTPNAELELSTCFPLTLECRTVRADADLAEEGSVGYLEAACADVTPTSCTPWRWDDLALDNAEIKYSGAELVQMKTAKAVSTLILRAVPGSQLQDFLEVETGSALLRSTPVVCWWG